MPAILDDPTSPTIYRVSGAPPYPDPNNPGFPADLHPRHVTLRDRQTEATIVPFASRHQLPASLQSYLCEQLNREIEGGDTYPMMDPFPANKFGAYWFQNFGAVMLLGHVEGAEEVVEGKDWSRECLGSFYIKPNYPGRSSHVCNAGFLVTEAARNRGVGRLMGEAYIDWAPRLGYTYSVFNLVYETNVASCKIWDALGFKRIGRVKGCGNLRSYPGQLIDAIIYGRDLGISNGGGEGGEELVSEERFDKIKFYLKYDKYPKGADRAEKSRLRSAATHYKLLDDGKLMLKDKEVISDPARQFEIARGVHVLQHGGINKTTATIAEKYHWSRIKETASDVIRCCVECKELGKTPNPGGMRKGAVLGSSSSSSGNTTVTTTSGTSHASGNSASTRGEPSSTTTTTTSASASTSMNPPGGRILPLQTDSFMSSLSQESRSPSPSPYANPNDITAISPSHTLRSSPADSQQPALHHDTTQHSALHPHHDSHQSSLHHLHHHHDPHESHHNHHHHHHNPMLQDPPGPSAYQPIDPQIIATPTADFEYHAHADFQALLNATEDGSDAVDRDLEMLIEHHDDDGDQDMEVMARGGLEVKDRGLYDMSFDGPGS